jgi:L-asparaginase
MTPDYNPTQPLPLFKPTLILHGGAGAILRSKLPPELYAQYHASLLSYLRSTYERLKNGATALDAAVHAVSLMEDDELFNCGRGSVFTSAGTIEMEASVMVTSVREDHPEVGQGGIKRGAGVIRVKNVRHPVQLAREVLLRPGVDENGDLVSDSGGNMHSQLSGPYVETLAKTWGLEFKPDGWFWTKHRWDEHRRGLRGIEEDITMAQGTVGCICLDQWGNLATATSTGGLTNKAPGRVGDTPTLGAGFWAESWVERRGGGEDMGMVYAARSESRGESSSNWGCTLSPWNFVQDLFLGDCLLRLWPWPSSSGESRQQPRLDDYDDDQQTEKQPLLTSSTSTTTQQPTPNSKPRTTRRAIALSGTGNGDSFLRVAAARTTSAMLRFSPLDLKLDLGKAITAIAGPDGELQQSAGPRWGKTGEGIGGIIGIEAELELEEEEEKKKKKMNPDGLRKGKVVYDFNCGGMWRAWMEEDDDGDGKERERVMVFREEYE